MPCPGNFYSFSYKTFFFFFGGFLHINVEYDRHHGVCVKIEIFINFSQEYRWSFSNKIFVRDSIRAVLFITSTVFKNP